MKTRILLLALALCLSLPSKASGADLHVQISRQALWPGHRSGGWGSVQISGNNAFGVSGGGFAIVDITDPGDLRLTGGTDPGSRYALAVSGNYGYLAVVSGLLVYDVSDPTNPQQVGQCPIDWAAFNVAIRGNYAFLTGGGGLEVYDVSDPANPRLAGRCAFESGENPIISTGLALSGDYVLVSLRSGELQLVDVSQPTLPRTARRLRVGSNIHAIAANEEYAYVSTDSVAGIQIVDLRNPEAPRLAGAISVRPFGARTFGALHVAGNYVYATGGDYDGSGEIGLQVIDVADPEAPRTVASFDEPGTPYGGVWVDGSRAYVADQTGFRVFNITDPENPQKIGQWRSLPWPDISTGVVTNNHAYVVDNVLGFQALDVSDPARPRLIGRLGAPEGEEATLRDLAVSGPCAYGVDVTGGLKIIDISDPAKPALAGRWQDVSPIESMSVAGRYVYTVLNTGSVSVVDVGEPARPTVVGTYQSEFAGGPHRLKASGNHLYLVSYEDATLEIIDVSDPPNPRRVGIFRGAIGPTIEISGDFVYLSGGGSRVQILDVHDPSNPQAFGAFNGPSEVSAGEVVISGNLAYVKETYQSVGEWDMFEFCELRVLDITNPASPRSVRTFYLGFQPRRSQQIRILAASGGFVYVTGGHLQILEMRAHTNSPRLSIRRRLGGVEVSWPEEFSYSGYELQRRSAQPNAPWETLGAGPELNGFIYQNVEALAGSAFFRLFKP